MNTCGWFGLHKSANNGWRSVFDQLRLSDIALRDLRTILAAVLAVVDNTQILFVGILLSASNVIN